MKVYHGETLISINLTCVVNAKLQTSTNLKLDTAVGTKYVRKSFEKNLGDCSVKYKFNTFFNVLVK